jgi:predicted acyl esterase
VSVSDELALRFQAGTSPAVDGVPEPRFDASVVGAMRVERNHAVRLADGVEIYVDLFRPVTTEPVPALIAWGPYGKHNGGNVYAQFRDDSGRTGGAVRPEWISPYTTFEGPDPQRWCSFGYAVINVDPRGFWWSGGDHATVWDRSEAQDAGDVIAWAAGADWSNGKVGMSGVSYLAVSQWWAASLRPPGLAAINPCEGLSDVYREFAFHGGIPSDFPEFWQKHRLKHSISKVEALADMMDARPLDDAYWEAKRPALEEIEVPAYVIASWSDQGLHTRGTLAAFERIGSAHKFLEVHGRKKWEYYHSPTGVARQRAFFDRFLKDVPNEVDDWPRVRLEVRRRGYDGVERRPATWPPAGTELLELHLDAGSGTLSETPAAHTAHVAYTASERSDGVAFAHRFTRAVDVIGPMRLRLWVQARDADDMDLFVAIGKLDAAGEEVPFPYANVLERGPVALGWLRVSQRELDPDRSHPLRPWHTHRSEQPLSPGEIVPVDVEVWPSGTRFEAGEQLTLRVLAHDPFPDARLWRHTRLRNRGTHLLHTGPDHPSSLRLGGLEPEAGAPRWESSDV